MDYDSASHEPRTNAEQSETDGDLRVSFESDEWADLDGPPRGGRRLRYFDHQLEPNVDYGGVLDSLEIDEARALFAELLDRFHLCDWRGLQLPPTDLPGFRRDGFHEEREEAKLLEIGVEYALAIIRNQPRAMHLRWQDAAAFISEIKRGVEDAVYIEQAQSERRAFEAREAAPQFVYFIGAESGPIKIGIATNPENRLKGLQTSHHERLSILAVCDGDLELEKLYHKRFKAHRLSGEWFERVPEIEAEIDRLTHTQEQPEPQPLSIWRLAVALACYDCGLPYAGKHWVEAVVPHDIWNNHLSPTGNEAGILCINCMAKRAVEAGLKDIPVRIAAGPFVAVR